MSFKDLEGQLVAGQKNFSNTFLRFAIGKDERTEMLRDFPSILVLKRNINIAPK